MAYLNKIGKIAVPTLTRIASGLVPAILLISHCFSAEVQAADKNFAPPQVQQNGSIVVTGRTDYTDLDFGPADLTFFYTQPEGEHFVTTGEHLYLHGETKLTQSHVYNPNGGCVSGREEIHKPRPDATGWDAWTILFARRLAWEFHSKYPGKEQVLLEVFPDGKIEIAQQLAFVPALDKNDNFVTEATVPNLRASFDEAVQSAVFNVSQSKRVKFPAEATATRALMLATFSVDKNLNTWFPDLRLVEDIPQTQEALWTARICGILDEGGLYVTSDRLRKLLPISNRRHFIVEGTYPKLEITGTATELNSLLTQDGLDCLYILLKDHLAQKRYQQAQKLAQSIANARNFKRVTNANHSWTAKFIPPNLEFTRHILDANFVRFAQKKIEAGPQFPGW